MWDFGQFTCGTDGINLHAHWTEYATHGTTVYSFLGIQACPSERFLFISFVSWQASPYSRQHDNELPESFSLFPCTAAARLCQGGRAVPELAPAAFQELAHTGAVAAGLFYTEAGAVEISCAVKTEKARRKLVKFWRMTLCIWCLKQVGMRLEESVGWESSWKQSTAFPDTSLH